MKYRTRILMVYRKLYSTETALDASEQRQGDSFDFFDLPAVFDTTEHHIMLGS